MGDKKSKTKIPESKLLKALAALESEIEKSDALEDADPEGGLSTEGAPLSSAAPSGKSDTKKARGASSSSSSAASDDASSSTAKAFSASDMASSKEPPPKKKKHKDTAKALPPPKDSASSSDDDSSSDDESDDDASSSSSTEKSFREVAEQDETMAKAIEVSDFIESMVDQLSHAFGEVTKSLARIEQRLAAHIDNRVAKAFAGQQSYNARLAQAVAAIGNLVQDDLVDVVKSLANSPAAPRGKAVLSKGEVNQPPWSGPGADQRMANGSEDGDFVAELRELNPEKIGDWLFKKSATNQLDPSLILAWEADRYNVEALPSMVRKALANDLLK